jgi:hypothetical protein
LWSVNQLLKPGTHGRAYAVDSRRGTAHGLDHSTLDRPRYAGDPNAEGFSVDILYPGAQYQNLGLRFVGYVHAPDSLPIAVTGPSFVEVWN